MGNLDLSPHNLASANLRPLEAYANRAPRKRTCLNGKLVHGNGVYTIDCTVHDISDGGAKITLISHQLLPSDVFLIVTRYGVAHEAKAVWTKFPARGLKFTKTYNLNAGLPDELKFLRKLWGDLYTRTGRDTLC